MSDFAGLESEYQNLSKLKTSSGRSIKTSSSHPLSWTELAANISPNQVASVDFKGPAHPFGAMGETMNYLIWILLAWFTAMIVWNMIEFFSGVDLV
jgi:hypothetical protein